MRVRSAEKKTKLLPLISRPDVNFRKLPQRYGAMSVAGRGRGKRGREAVRRLRHRY